MPIDFNLAPLAEDRFGSAAVIGNRAADVCLGSEADIEACHYECPLWAKADVLLEPALQSVSSTEEEQSFNSIILGPTVRSTSLQRVAAETRCRSTGFFCFFDWDLLCEMLRNVHKARA